MDKEEKKVKTTTPKKTTAKKTDTNKTVKRTAAKQTTNKSEAKAKPVRKATTKKATTKTTAEKKVTTTKTTKKVELPKTVVPKEEVKIEEKKVVTKEKENAKPSEELVKIRRKRHIIEAVIIAVLVIFALILVFNRSFLGVNYKNDSISVSIPRFSYFVGDKDNTVKFITLRKSKYLNDYYNEYLEGFIFYSCAEGENTFYYNEKSKTLIKEIKVEKKFALKTIEITYDTRTPEEVCGLR